MTLFRSILGAVFVFMLAASAGAEECAFGESDGDRGATFNDLPYYWVFNVFADRARAYGVAKVYGLSDGSTANTVFEIDRSDSAARKGRTYRSFVETNYWPKALPPRALKAKLEIGGSATEFAVQEKERDSLTNTIDLTPLYPALIGSIRKGELVHLTILDGDTKFIEQYLRGATMKKRFDWMEAAMQEIFATADAGKCPETPAPAPPSGGGGGTGGGMGIL